MIISHVRIHNYRSIKDVSFQANSIMVFVGPNNHGKSNILKAIEFALSTSAKIEYQDFFTCRDEDNRENCTDYLWVELTFSKLTDQENNTFRKYVSNDGSVKVRKTARRGVDGKIEIGYQGYMYEPEEWWLRSDAYIRLKSQEHVRVEAEEVPPLERLLEGGGQITKDRVSNFQQTYITEHKNVLVFTEVLVDASFLGTKNVGGGALPDFYLVPAVRDLIDETKLKTTTTFGRLMQRALQDMASRDDRFIDIERRLQSLVEELNKRPDVDDAKKTSLALLESSIINELKEWGVRVLIEVSPPEIEKLFELGTELYLDDGIKTSADRKGHGLQRAVLFAMLRAWAKRIQDTKEEESLVARRSSDSIIFAIEEPELFLHPQAQRLLSRALEEIADTSNHQVFVCSHSTHFVNLDKYQSLAIVTKNNINEGSSVKQCTQDLFAGDNNRDKKDRFHMAFWINPDRGELFFARKVVLVEGETEKVLLPFLAAKMGCLDPGISIIDCGSKHNLPLYITILNGFRLPYCVIHDEDPLPDPIPPEWNEEKTREKHRTFTLNLEIGSIIDRNIGERYILSPDFEGISGVTKRQGDRKGKVIAALEYFSEVRAENIPEEIRNIIRISFA
jgi:putative ATP-dependent endonuclease of the OLD family